MGNGSKKAQGILNDLVKLEARRLRELGALVADRIDQDPTDVSFDHDTGVVLGALSDAARAARLALAQRIIKMGGEDPSWGS